MPRSETDAVRRPRKPARATADGVVNPVGRAIALVVIGALLLGSVAVFLLLDI